MTATVQLTIQSIYDSYGCYQGSTYSQKIVQWMTDRGITGYAEDIRVAQEHYMETICDAGRYWAHCEFTREALTKINDNIDETFRAATDRYQDWASD